MNLLRIIWLQSLRIGIVLALSFGIWGFVSFGVWQGILLAIFSLIAGVFAPITTALSATVFMVATDYWYIAVAIFVIGFIIEGRAIKSDIQNTLSDMQGHK
jgi:hypothetical protein